MNRKTAKARRVLLDRMIHGAFHAGWNNAVNRRHKGKSTSSDAQLSCNYEYGDRIKNSPEYDILISDK